MLPYPLFMGVVSVAVRQMEQHMQFCAVCLAYLRFHPVRSSTVSLL